MTLNEVYAQYPELQDEVDRLVRNSVGGMEPFTEKTADNLKAVFKEAVDKAISNERKRIQDIETIAGAIPTDLVTDAKYHHPCNARELAFHALKTDGVKAAYYMTAAFTDYDQS